MGVHFEAETSSDLDCSYCGISGSDREGEPLCSRCLGCFECCETLHDEGQHETFETETFEAKSKKGFEWEYWDYDDEKAKQSYGKYAGENTIKPAVQKAEKQGWKRIGFNSKYRPKIWGLMAQSPQWKPWVKDLTARCKYERNIMGETISILNGTAYWKKPGQYNPDHMGEDGGWEILTKDNKILLFYYYRDDELCSRLMRKTFTVPKAPARKPAAKKTTTRKSKPKAKSGRKGPDISATKRKIGTRMRGNDGNMWEVKPAGKSQRWVRGAEDNLGPMFMAESKSTMPKIPKGIKTGGWQQAAYIYSNGDIFSIEDFSEVYGMPVYDIWHYSGNIPKIDAPKNTWIYDDEVESWDWDKILDKAKNQVNKEYNTLRAEEKKNCGCGQDPCVTYGAETFEAPKTMTPLQAKNKFIALAQPYWIKALTKLKEGYIQEKKDDDKRRGGESEYYQQYDYDIEDTNTYLKIAKSPSKIKNIIGCDEGDTVLREMIPDGFYHLINYPREDYYTWENTMFYFEGPKAIQKQLKALLPIIKGKVTVKPKATKKTTTRKAKPKAKAGRKAPTISATKRKIGTRMRGNDGKMWEVKKSGKSQRWMAGAESEAESANSEPIPEGDTSNSFPVIPVLGGVLLLGALKWLNKN